MFGWLRRRVEREHAKLVYQNYEASNDGELKIALLVNGFDDRMLEPLQEQSAALRSKMRSGQNLTSAEFSAALETNKELRRIYDVCRRSGRKPFDGKYAPLGGWAFFFERNGATP